MARKAELSTVKGVAPGLLGMSANVCVARLSQCGLSNQDDYWMVVVMTSDCGDPGVAIVAVVVSLPVLGSSA
jgi:hypothetical protein